MIDRIEELLSEMAAEDEEEQEDVLALTVAEETIPASPRRNRGEAGDGKTGDRSGGRTAEEIALEQPGLIAGETVLGRPGPAVGETGDGGLGDRSGGRTAGEIALERPGLIVGETEAAEESAPANRELWKNGPVWTVRGGVPEMEDALRTAAVERMAQAEAALQRLQGGDLTGAGLEWAVRGSTADPALESAGRSGHVQAGLEGLYRQTVRGLRPTAPALPPEQAGKTARAQEPGSAASLAVDELDRAVRRDSRRYDGGMSIY